MELFILLHSNAYESADGRIIACSLFRENLIERMNSMAIKENEKLLELAYQKESRSSNLYVYNQSEDSWTKWNGKKWTERLSIQQFEMS